MKTNIGILISTLTTIGPTATNTNAATCDPEKPFAQSTHELRKPSRTTVQQPLC